MKKTKLYNLEYWINKVHKETPVKAKPLAIVKWQKRLLKKSSHKLGELIIAAIT